MQHPCAECGTAFETDASDLAFYEQVSPVIGTARFPLPPPTQCPQCRQRRRLAYRNEHTFYRNTCKSCGRVIVSVIGEGNPQPVYCSDCWLQGSWQAQEFGQLYDSQRSFFTQCFALRRSVPYLALSIWNSVNSNYCNYIGDVKNSYLLFGPVYSEDCYYGSPYYSKDCVDSLVIRNCERCYECIDSRQLYDCRYCQDCHSSQNLTYCFDCLGCHDCIGCAGLRHQSLCILNEQYSQEEFEKRKTELNLEDPAVRSLLSEQLRSLSLQIPHRSMQSNQVEDVSGNYVYQSQRVHDSYYADRSQDCRYCAQVVDLKDCQDLNFTEEDELCYEYLGAYQNSRLLFSLFCNHVHESQYCDACHRCKHLFGCIGLRDSEYCILNKQYTKEEYEALVPKIIERMKEDGEWGEFFPISGSPFGYNETVASEYFPATEEEARKRGWQWQENLPYTTGRETVAWESVPNPITEVPDRITQEILGCESCRRNFRIIPQELKFYRSMRLPLPHHCFDCRHRKRIERRNPRQLWDRACAKCGAAMRTTYAPDRPEIVYCETCYLASLS